MYIDVLDKFVEQYNNTKHSSIKMTPRQASMKKNEDKVYNNLYGDMVESSSKGKAKFKLGNLVRIPRKRGVFEKGYTVRWTEEVFKVVGIFHTNPITYKLEDLNGEEIQGSFYEQELQKSRQQVYRIEKVLKKLGNKVYVQWAGYVESFNSWIDADSVERTDK